MWSPWARRRLAPTHFLERSKIVKDDKMPAERAERAPFVREFRKRILENAELLAIREEVKEMASKFPLFTW